MPRTQFGQQETVTGLTWLLQTGRSELLARRIGEQRLFRNRSLDRSVLSVQERRPPSRAGSRLLFLDSEVSLNDSYPRIPSQHFNALVSRSSNGECRRTLHVPRPYYSRTDALS